MACGGRHLGARLKLQLIKLGEYVDSAHVGLVKSANLQMFKHLRQPLIRDAYFHHAVLKDTYAPADGLRALAVFTSMMTHI